jgi:hypothetical protein
MPNPRIPLEPCFRCGKATSETQSVYGVRCYDCFMEGSNMHITDGEDYDRVIAATQLAKAELESNAWSVAYLNRISGIYE